MALTVSLIITTYNWPKALALSIQSALRQTRLPDEIIIADDGSSKDTANMLESIKSNVPILHSWQEDQGFALAMSRNRAIAKSRGEYIIVVDGDMVLHPDFIADHLACAKEGIYLQGGRVLLDEAFSKRVLKEDKVSFSWYDSGLKNRKNALHIKWLGRLFCQENQRLKGIRGCNFSLFKSDIVRVNGFNEAFTSWGREDSEFVQRLYHAGIKRQNLKFCAIEYHLYHDEGAAESKNDALLQKTIDEKLHWCEHGIDQYLQKKEGVLS